MTLLRLPLAALVLALGAGTAIATDRSAPPVAPAATAVLVQAPSAPLTGVSLPAEARRLQAAGADVTVVYGSADATAAAIRAAATHGAVLGSGPAVRQALTRAALDHPEVRFGSLDR